jgi:hypothetical protein
MAQHQQKSISTVEEQHDRVPLRPVHIRAFSQVPTRLLQQIKYALQTYQGQASGAGGVSTPVGARAFQMFPWMVGGISGLAAPVWDALRSPGGNWSSPNDPFPTW